MKRRPMLAGDDGYRLSLAGAQDKLAVRLSDHGEIQLVKSAPTTHILKPVIEGLKDTAHNELFCMSLAQNIGIEAPQAGVYYAGHSTATTEYYLIKRYDRKIEQDGSISRIHQEDFCQA